MKVGLQGCFSCNYFTEDLSCYAPETVDDIFIDELRSPDAEENKNLGNAPENWDSNEDVRRYIACREKKRSESCGLMFGGGCSAPRHQQQKRARAAIPVVRVNADSDEHILREKLAEFEMVQGIEIADQEVRQPGGGAQRTLDSSDGDLYYGGRSTETRAPTRANRTDWTVSRLNMRPQNCFKRQATRKRRTSLVGQQSLMCLMSTQSKAQERRLIKLALEESLREAAAVTVTTVPPVCARLEGELVQMRNYANRA